MRARDAPQHHKYTNMSIPSGQLSTLVAYFGTLITSLLKTRQVHKSIRLQGDRARNNIDTAVPTRKVHKSIP